MAVKTALWMKAMATIKVAMNLKLKLNSILEYDHDHFIIMNNRLDKDIELVKFGE